MSRVAGWVPGSRAAVHRLERKMAEQNGHYRLATPGDENRDDETNTILGFQRGNREHEESMTYTILSGEGHPGRSGRGPGMVMLDLEEYPIIRHRWGRAIRRGSSRVRPRCDGGGVGSTRRRQGYRRAQAGWGRWAGTGGGMRL